VTRRFCASLLLAGALVLVSSALCQEHGAPGSHAAAEHGGGHGDPLIVEKVINFAILAALLGFFAVKLGGPFFRGRADEIRKSIDDARAVREDAEKRAKAIEGRISNLAGELDQLRAESKREMASEERRIQEETARLAAKLEQNAAQEIEQATKRAEQELRAHAARLAVQVAEERVKARMTPSTQGALVRRFVDDLGKRVN
jgi:F-type H+-transporting ATPase subunit b